MKKKPVLLLLFILLNGISAQESLCIIAHPAVKITTIEKSMLRSIFLGKKTRWDDGQKISPVVFSDGILHQSFLETVVDKSSYAFDNYWRQRIYTGKGVPPVQFGSEAEVIAYIEKNPGAIGYISGSAAGRVSDRLQIIGIQNSDSE